MDFLARRDLSRVRLPSQRPFRDPIDAGSPPSTPPHRRLSKLAFRSHCPVRPCPSGHSNSKAQFPLGEVLIMRMACAIRRLMVGLALLPAVVPLAVPSSARAEPDPSTYWDVKDIRPGMTGVGRTVMVGTKLEEFEARGPGGPSRREPGSRHGSLSPEGVPPGAFGDHPGDEREPDLHRRQAAGGGGLCLGVRQGPDRGGHTVRPDGPVRPLERAPDRGRGAR